jgi:hypothetical protein
VTPADAFFVSFDDSDPESEAYVIDGANAEVAADMCIEETRKHMSSIDSMVIVNYPNG